jgi:hypothetical protein
VGKLLGSFDVKSRYSNHSALMGQTPVFMPQTVCTMFIAFHEQKFGQSHVMTNISESASSRGTHYWNHSPPNPRSRSTHGLCLTAYLNYKEPGSLSRDSDWLRSGRPEVPSSSPGRGRDCLFSTTFRLALGPTQPNIQWVPGSLSLGVERPGRETDHSPPTSAEVKNKWMYTTIPPYVFMA